MPPRFRDLKRYCDKHLHLLRDTDHFYYEGIQSTGEIVRTKVSHALNKEIPANLWAKILKNQLKISEQEFWDGI